MSGDKVVEFQKKAGGPPADDRVSTLLHEAQAIITVARERYFDEDMDIYNVLGTLSRTLDDVRSDLEETGRIAS